MAVRSAYPAIAIKLYLCLMIKLLLWFEKHRTITVLLSIAYFLAVVTFHDEVTDLAVWLRKRLTVSGYNMFFTIASLLGFIAWIWLITKKLKWSSDFRVIFIFLFPTVLLIAVFFIFMQTYAIEAVHFFQYALLAILLFPLVRSFGTVVFLTTFLGMTDEIFQYLVLTPRFGYFDLNDILLNLLGAGLAAVSIYLATDFRTSRKDLLTGALSVISAVVLFSAGYTIAWCSGLVRWEPATAGIEPGWFHINRIPQPSTFWREVYTGKFIHIIKPWEGAFLSAAFFIYYFVLDFLPPENGTRTSRK